MLTLHRLGRGSSKAVAPREAVPIEQSGPVGKRKLASPAPARECSGNRFCTATANVFTNKIIQTPKLTRA